MSKNSTVSRSSSVSSKKHLEVENTFSLQVDNYSIYKILYAQNSIWKSEIWNECHFIILFYVQTPRNVLTQWKMDFLWKKMTEHFEALVYQDRYYFDGKIFEKSHELIN